MVARLVVTIDRKYREYEPEPQKDKGPKIPPQLIALLLGVAAIAMVIVAIVKAIGGAP
jgi:hypothetical protein